MAERGNFNQQMEKAQRSLLDFLFPRKCPFCGKMVGKQLLCQTCEDELTKEIHRSEGGGYGRCCAPLTYEGRVRDALLRFKFHGDMGGLECFGRLLADTAAAEYSGDFDAITWVPVSKKRLKKRGFDQARYLAASLCVDWHVDPIETLCKTVDNPPQSGVEDRDCRKANVLGVYEAVSPEQFSGKRLLLVDDIFTTGSTLGEAARVLRAAGAADVVCLTLAMTPEKE